MAIAKQKLGEGFGGIIMYMHKKEKKGVGELLYSNLISSSPKELSREFRMVSELKPNLKKVVYHTSLSLSKDDRQISNSTFIEIGHKYLKEMGFEKSQYLIYRHTDREHQHIHMIANRVTLDGKTVSDSNNYARSEAVVRQIEQDHNLIKVKSSKEVMEKSMTKEEVGLYKRKHVIPVRKQLQIIAKDALTKATSLEEFEKLIVKSGAELQLHRNQKGNLYGASFQLDNVTFKASGLGKGYSINKILKQIEINNERNRGTSEKTSTGKLST